MAKRMRYDDRVMDRTADHYEPGQRVTVTQQVQHKKWTSRVTGTVVRYEQRKTGAWYAHAKDAKLWLDRLVLRKDDGEIVECNLDPYTHVGPAPAQETSSG